MNIRKSNSSFGINNFGSSRNLSSSQCSLEVTALRGGRSGRQSLGLTESLARTNKVEKRKSLPAGLLTSTKTLLSPQVTITEED